MARLFVNTLRAQVQSISKYARNASSLIGRDFLTLKDYEKDEIETLLWTAKDLKCRLGNGEIYEPLKGKVASLIFQKRSTRTRLSSETAFSLLGGKACFLSPDDIHLGVNETIRDSAVVLSRFSDVILARVYGQKVLDDLANFADRPIVSGLSDTYHPLQALADILTLQEHFGYVKGLKCAWVGDGNNIIHSLILGGLPLGMEFRVATPSGYECFDHVIKDAKNLAEKHQATLTFTNNPFEAVSGADVVVTDTWISMGQEDEKEARLKAFADYRVTKKLMSNASKEAVFLHCLPRKQEEVDDEVFYDPARSLVWEEAENRKWTVMSVFLHLLANHRPLINKPKF
ncbi:DgyrCDS6189 [Dimorphilus gyrociliatus]|uniref:ornithine carbamoyltransferase n=1 Tax=Dimorphilus gyrociliatus TaxID=2664684 RepID=A0A7I8VNY0_9ANNE|nr:DgyrCDS6189 [Dimorphilus gyrociliatus]